jgi:hypothetical protein
VAAEAEADDRHETGAQAVPAVAPPAPSPSPAGPADTERYELLDRIGVGGMAEVYKARASGAHGFQKIVAIKRILPELAARPEFVARFIAEAKLAVALTHANIVQVLDLAREADRLYIAMEFIEGGDLALLMRSLARAQQKASLGFALFVGIEMLRGLHHAHSRKDEQGRPLGIVHRDVSPSNILLSLSGEVKVADFGIALAAWAAHLPERVMGKRRYMSPEQARGDEVDARGDVYAAACVIYELCTGSAAFERAADATTATALDDVVNRGLPPPPSRKRPDLPPALDELLLKALAPRAEDRFASAGDFGAALEQVAFDARIRVSSAEAAELAQAHLGARPDAGQVDAAFRAAMGTGAGTGSAAARRTSSLTEGMTEFFVRKDQKDGLSQWVVGPNGTVPVPAASVPPERTPVAAAPTVSSSRPAVAAQIRKVVGISVVGAIGLATVVGYLAWGAARSAGRSADPDSRAQLAATSPPAGPAADAALATALAAPATAADAAAAATAPTGDPVADALAAGGATADGSLAATAAPSDAAAADAGGDDSRPGPSPESRAAGSRAAAARAEVLNAMHEADARRPHLSLESQPSGAVVQLDGRTIGETPLVRTTVEPGRHRIRLTRSGHEPLEFQVTMAEGEHRQLRKKLAAEAAYGLVNLFVEPWGHVSCEGRRVGTASPTAALKLKAGKRRLVVSNPGAKVTREVDVTVVAGKTQLVKVNLKH